MGPPSAGAAGEDKGDGLGCVIMAEPGGNPPGLVLPRTSIRILRPTIGPGSQPQPIQNNPAPIFARNSALQTCFANLVCKSDLQVWFAIGDGSGESGWATARSRCGRSLVVKPQPSKLMMRVRFPPPACFSRYGFSAQGPCCYWLYGFQPEPEPVWPCQAVRRNISRNLSRNVSHAGGP